MEARQTQIEKGWGFCLRKTSLGGGLEQGWGEATLGHWVVGRHEDTGELGAERCWVASK